MQNPFESGHIKNYILLYASVVVIMILFFIASRLFGEVQDVEKRVFKTDSNKSTQERVIVQMPEQNSTSRYKLLDKAY